MHRNQIAKKSVFGELDGNSKGLQADSVPSIASFIPATPKNEPQPTYHTKRKPGVDCSYNQVPGARGNQVS